MTLAGKVVVRVPASTANLGPGFDTIGMALNLYHWIEMSWSDEPIIQCYGEHLDGIALDESNLIYKTAMNVFKMAGIAEKPLQLSMYSEIPLARGLGSSASAIIGGLVAANSLIGQPLKQDQLFQMASSIEEHPDNVGASLFGGIVVAYWDGSQAAHIRLDVHPDLACLVVIPDFKLLTSKARDVLPKQVSMKEAIFNISHASLLTAALSTGNLSMIPHAMKDAIHQPYRCALIPGMEDIIAQATQHGALGVALSGAGPTMIAFVERTSPNKERLQQFISRTFLNHRIANESMWLNPVQQGAEVLTHFDEKCTFIENIQREKQP